MRRYFLTFSILPWLIFCFPYRVVANSNTDRFEYCKKNCKNTINSPNDLKGVKQCYSNCLSGVCKEFKLRCKCTNDNGLLKPDCSYCCKSPKIETDINLCSDEDLDEEPEETECEQFRNSDWCPDCISCYKPSTDSSHCNDLTRVTDCLVDRVHNSNKTNSCKHTLINCRCTKDANNANKIGCFWGCEDKESDNWHYYATPQVEKYITNETDNADDGGTVCPECPSCVDNIENEKIEDTILCIEKKLLEKFKLFKAHCYCIKDENEVIHKKCMWHGIELQCRPGSDMCNRQVVGSYGIPLTYLNRSYIVDCSDESTSTSINVMPHFVLHISTVLIAHYFHYFG